MSVRFLSHDNQDAAYAKAAAIGAATGYLTNSLLPPKISGPSFLQTKIIAGKAKAVGMASKVNEYRLIKKEIQNGTIALDTLAQDVFNASKKELLRGRIDDVLAKGSMTSDAQETLKGISKRIIEKGVETKKAIIDNADKLAKNAKGSAFSYAIFGALAALSYVTITNSAKSISDITGKPSFDVNA